MTTLNLFESGKAINGGAKLRGSAQIIINADGTKPRMFAKFDDTLNELVGELVLTNVWNKNLPTHYTIGRNLRQDYANALQMKRGIFVMKAMLDENYLYKIHLSFIDSSTEEFKTIKFIGISYDAKERTLEIPRFKNDDYEVFLEESLVGMLKPAFDAVTARCVKRDFINKLSYAFTLNKYGCPVDQRNRTIQQVCG